MKKTTKIRIALISLIVCIFTLIVGPIMSNNNIQSKAESANIKDGTLMDVYAYNIMFTVPEVTVVTPEGEVSCSTASVIFPDGNCYTGNTYLFSQCGKYTIIYDTGKYQASKTFNVYDDNWGLSSTSSKAEYVQQFDYSRYVKDNFAMRLNNGRGGISVDLVAGDTFTYNVPININEADGLFDVIKCYPEVWDKDTNKTKARFVTVKLIDCYDSSNFIEFVWWVNDAGTSVFASAGGSNQEPVGLEWQQYNGYKNETFEFEDGYYLYWDIDFNSSLSQYGTSCGNPSLTNDNNLLKHGGMNFQYDVNDMKVFSSYTTAKNGSVDENGYLLEQLSYKRLVNDLNASELCEDRGRKPFEGFTTGECYLSLQTYGNYSSSLHIDIESIFGRTGEQLQATSYVDKTKPVLTFIDGNSYDKPMYIQKGVEVSLPKAKVLDINGTGLYSVTVYENYGTSFQTKVSSANNTFMPNSSATYSAIYKAVDDYGNTTEKIVNFVVSEQGAISYDENKLEKLHAGEVNIFPDINASGINGEVVVTITIKNPKGEIEVIDSTTREYTPQYLGEYTVNYEISDGIAVNNFPYKIACEDNGKVAFKDDFYVDKYFIKTATYGLEDYYAYAITEDGLTAKLCNVYVSFDGEEFKKLDNPKSFLITANSTVDIKMECNGQFGNVYRVEVVDVNYNTTKMSAEDYSKYFMNDNAIFSATSSSFNFKFDGTTNTETLRFINPLSLSNFYLSFEIPTEKKEDGTRPFLGGFNKLEIKLIDYYNDSIALSCIYEETKKGISYTMDKTTVALDGISIKDLKETFFVQDGILNGNRGGLTTEISAFTGDLCYLEITLSGISGESGLAIKKINNQTFSKTISPAKTISVTENIGGAFEQFATYQINPTMSTSVLQPIAKDAITIQLLSPSGKVVTAENGVELQNAKNDYYIVKLNEIGNYELSYVIELPNGEVETIPTTISSIDTEAPTVTFDKGYTEDTLITIKRGATHTVSYKVSDNHTATENITATVMYTTDKGEVVGIGDSSFTFKYKGNYRVIVLAMDEIGNTTTAYYNILVK